MVICQCRLPLLADSRCLCQSHWTPTSHNSVMEMARVLSSVHAISTTCSVCWTSLCAACLYIIASPDSQFLCMHVWSTVLSILISKLFDWQIQLTHACLKHVLHTPSLIRNALQYKNSWAFKHSDPCKCSPGSYSQLVSCSVGIMISCLLLEFPLLVSLASLHLCCLWASVSRTRNCARLLIVHVATPVLKAASRPKWSCMATMCVM